jgi:hypothetical protein
LGGPHTIVRDSEKDSFVAAVRLYLNRTGQIDRVLKIDVGPCSLRRIDTVLTGQAKIDQFCEFLQDEGNWH